MKLILIFFFGIFLSLSCSAQYIIGKSYFGINNYVEYIPGNLPIIIVAPHAGELKPDSLPDIQTRGRDNGTMDLTLLLKDSIPAILNGCMPHIIINHVHASKFSPVNVKLKAAGTHPWATQAWDEFHEFIDSAKAQVTADWGAGHYFEIHGNGHSNKWTEVGLGISKSYLNQGDSAILSRSNNTTVGNLITNGGVDLLELINGETSLGGMLMNKGWKSVPSPTFPSPDTNGFFYAGWNTWKHGSNKAGSIDATHLENYWEFMVKSVNKYKYAGDVAHSMIDFMKIHYKMDLDCSVLSQPEILAVNELKIYPNPSTGKVFVTISNPEIVEKLEVVNIFGSVIYQAPKIERNQQINLENGFYFFRVQYVDESSEVRKILIRP